jgi:hypothetical protein
MTFPFLVKSTIILFLSRQGYFVFGGMRPGPDTDHTFAHLYIHKKREIRPRRMLLGTIYTRSQKGNILRKRTHLRKEYICICIFSKKHNTIHLVPHICTSSLYWPGSCFSLHGLHSCMLKKDNMCHKFVVGER